MTPVEIACGAEVGFQLTAAALAALDPPPAWGHTGPQALQRQVTMQVGPAAGQTAAALWRMLHRIRWRTVEGEVVPVDHVTTRQLAQLHRLATDLFTALSQRS